MLITGQFGKICTKADLKNMRRRLKKSGSDGQGEFSSDDKPTIDRAQQLNAVIREIRDAAEASSDDVFAQNLAFLKSISTQWKKGRVASLSEDNPSGSERNAPYPNVFTEDGTSDILIEYNSPHSYLIPADTHE